jgi:gamma-glutamylcyclotransferase (GGCT)/AIG2-like uncharacterized protein YtfP
MLIGVYGTLKKGHGNHRLLEGQELVGNITLEGFVMHSLGGFPAIVEGEGSVVAEVYQVEDGEVLRRLDSLEGYDKHSDSGMYLRRTVATDLGEVSYYLWNSGIERLGLAKKNEEGHYEW